LNKVRKMRFSFMISMRPNARLNTARNSFRSVKNPKAIALFSGGLDSTLAVKMLLDQGVDVEAINFVSPFCQCGRGGCDSAETANKLNIPLKIINVGSDYLRKVRKPLHGYGKHMNPCIDCRIFMLKKAKKYARQTGAAFLCTGEVLGQRPMSQHRQAFDTIEKEAGLKGKILRPLSAKLLPETIAEKKGLVNRERLMNVEGRSRKPQLQMAKKAGITDYPCPAGGCLLTDEEFAAKIRDLFQHKTRISLKDVLLLKTGRHFRHGKNKIIVGRNETENNALLQKKNGGDYWFEAQDCGSPITLLQGPKTRESISLAAQLTAYHSDQKSGKVTIAIHKGRREKSTLVHVPTAEEVHKLRIRWHN
jgi:tRNA-specific 2-thiouridylase